MIFSSILFLTIFLPLFLIGYFVLPRWLNLKHIYLLAASFLFYAWGEPVFVVILFLTTIADFLLVRKMSTIDDPTKRKLFLALPILLNVGMLVYFKYCNFFIDNLNHLGFSISNLSKIVLPIGISFYTFESITYSVDVYRRVHAPLKKFWEYQMYIIFFPKLIAGPIVRYHEIADQIQTHIHHDHFRNRVNGFIRFCIGLGKKVLIANVVGQQADAIFSMDVAHLSTAASWIGALAYTVQIYFDFSGYSDMAIGISQILGFRLPENFNNPYTSKSVTEFWKRWHITLGNWMKNYLYIPLGGNRVGLVRVLINLFIVFLLSGLWHGAGWNFILWGAYFGVFLIIERLLRRSKPIPSLLGYLGWVYTFIVVVVGWVLFRNDDVEYALAFIKNMFAFDFSQKYIVVLKPDFLPFFIAGLVFSFCALNRHVRSFQEKLFGGTLPNVGVFVFAGLGICTYLVCLLVLSGGSFNPFIYFKF